MAEAGLSIKIMAENLAKAAFQGAESDVDSLQGKWHGFSESMVDVGAKLTAGITLPLAGIAAEAIHMSADFDTSMQKIVALVGVGQEQVTAWKGDIMKLSEETGKSSKEMGDALFFITSAGLKGSEAFDALEASSRASVAGLGSMKTVADAVTSAMNSYAGSNLKAGDATGIMIAAVREGKMPAEALASSIGRVLPLAAQMGVGFDQVGAAIASYTRLGLSADEGTTRLQAVMVGLLKPSEGAQTALKAVGLSADYLRQVIKENGLMDALMLLRDRVGDNDAAYAKILPNVRALSGFLALTGENAQANIEIFQRLKTAGVEDLDKAFEIMNETIGHKLEVAMTSVHESFVKLGDILMPTVVPAVTAFTRVVQAASGWIEHLDPTIRNAAIGFGIAVAAIGPFLTNVGAIGLAIEALMTPMGAAVVAVGLLGAAYGADMGGIRTSVEGAVNGILASMRRLQADEGLGGVDAALAAISMQIGVTFGPQAASDFDHFTQVVGDVASAFGTLGDAIKTGFETGDFNGLFDQLGQMGARVLDWITEESGPIGEKIQTEWLPALGGWIETTGIPWLLEKLGGLADRVLDWIGEQAPPLLAKIEAEWVPAMYEWILGTALPKMIEKLGEMVISLLSWSESDGGPKWVVIGGKLAGAFADGAMRGLTKLRDDLYIWFDELGPKINAKLEELGPGTTESAKQLGAAIIQGIVLGVAGPGATIAVAVVNQLKGAYDAAAAFIQKGSPSKLFANEIGVPMAEGVAAGLLQATPGVVTAIEDMMGEASATAATAADGFSKAIAAGVRSSDLEGQFGQVGGRAVTALLTAFESGTEQAGSTAANAVLSMIQGAERSGIPGAHELGLEIMHTVATALASGDQELLAAGIAQIADLSQSMAEYAAGAGQRKLVEGFNHMADDALLSLRIKMSPEEGGGIVNTFMGAVYQSFVDDSPRLQQSIESMSRGIINALKSHLSPSEAAAAIGDFQAAMSAYWETGDISGLLDFLARNQSAFVDGFEKMKKPARDAADAAIRSISEVANNSDAVKKWGEVGSKAMSALQAGFEHPDDTDAGAKFANSTQQMIEAASKAGMPMARELGAKILAEGIQGMQDHNEDLIHQSEADAASYWNQYVDWTKTKGLQKIADAFAAGGDQMIATLRLKIAPSKGGGLANVMIDALNAANSAIDEKKPEAEQHAAAWGQTVREAIARTMSPEKAAQVIADWDAVYATHDPAAARAFFDKYPQLATAGMDAVKAVMQQSIPPLIAQWHDAAETISGSWANGMTVMVDATRGKTESIKQLMQDTAAGILQTFTDMNGAISTIMSGIQQGYHPGNTGGGTLQNGGSATNGGQTGSGGTQNLTGIGQGGSSIGSGYFNSFNNQPIAPAITVPAIAISWVREFLNSMAAGAGFTSLNMDALDAMGGDRLVGERLLNIASSGISSQNGYFNGDWAGVARMVANSLANESGNALYMARGGSGIVTRPTMFIAGEAGPEAFSFTPMGRGRSAGGGGEIHVHYNQNAPVYGILDLEDQILDTVALAVRRGALTQPIRSAAAGV